MFIIFDGSNMYKSFNLGSFIINRSIALISLAFLLSSCLALDERSSSQNRLGLNDAEVMDGEQNTAGSDGPVDLALSGEEDSLDLSNAGAESHLDSSMAGVDLSCEQGSGPCCDDETGLYKTPGTICEVDAVKEFSCSDGIGCGRAVYTRVRPLICDGSSVSCDQLGEFSEWTIAESCDLSAACVEGQSRCEAQSAMCDASHPYFCESHTDFTLCDDSEDTERIDICIDHRCVSPGCLNRSCNTGGPHFPWPNRSRYFTVSDQDDEGNFIATDSITGLSWTKRRFGRTPYSVSESRCENLDFGGHQDWRLPDRYELQSLIDYTRYDSALDPTVFQNYPGYFVWSSSAYDDLKVYAVALNDGSVDIFSRDSGLTELVMCVRGAPASFSQSMQERWEAVEVNGEVLIRSLLSGHVWQSSFAEPMNWDEAVAHCEELSYGGRDDWRLPKILESSFFTDDRTETTLPSVLEGDSVAREFWIGEPWLGGPHGSAWTMALPKLAIRPKNKDSDFYVRCVAGGDL